MGKRKKSPDPERSAESRTRAEAEADLDPALVAQWDRDTRRGKSNARARRRIADRDVAYRKALGIAAGQELPATIGTTGVPGAAGSGEVGTDGSDDVAEMLRWSLPAPVAVPEMRAAMARQMKSPYEVIGQAGAIAAGQGTITGNLPPTTDPQAAARVLCAQEHQRLVTAELFFVSAEMTRLAVQAGESLPDFHLEPEDVPSPSGFIVFAEPIGSYIDSAPGGAARIPIVAASWGQYQHEPAVGLLRLARGGVWITFYAPTDLARVERQLATMYQRPLRARERDQMRLAYGAPLAWDNEIIGPYGAYGAQQQAGFQPGSGHQDRGRSWPQTIRAAWLLMVQEGIADTQMLHRSRTATRRDERDGYSTEPVRLLHLRRATHAQGAPDEEDAARDWTCRWMVRGHWRQQWYPSRQAHRPLWINPHIKGPDGKPLKTGQTVHLWDR